MGQRHTLVHRLADWAERKPDEPAIHGKIGGNWRHKTWKEYWEAVRGVAKGLIALGHQPGECVAIVGNNRMEWVVCQFGIMAARGIPAPIYTTNTVDQIAYIVQHSRSKIAICDTLEQLKKYREATERGLMSVEAIVTMDAMQSLGEGVMSLAELLDLGDKRDDSELDKRLKEVEEKETSLLIYTSGTTGVPKAVELNHSGMIAVSEAALEKFPIFQQPGTFALVSYLPLCHVAEQLFTNLLHLASGGKVYFCPDIKQMKDHLVAVRPTLFLGVPRVWEKFQAAMTAKFAEARGVKAKLLAWARRVELDAVRKDCETGKKSSSLCRKLANKLVLGKIKTALGLDRLLVAVTGAAPISLGTLEFFASIGIPLYEGYGMSETTAVATVAPYGKPRFGAVGTPLSCVEVKIADDGEVLLKGPGMTRGYLHMPEKTEELFTKLGWLQTGDLGSMDDEGYLRITGRKKDLIITAGGKNVAPAELEAYIQQIPGVGQAVVVGDRQPYLCALVTLDPEGTAELAERLDLENSGLAYLANNQKVRQYVQEQVEKECNAKVARYQTIKKIELLPVEFSVDSGELTPTMKIKRNVVHEKYAEAIGAFYA